MSLGSGLAVAGMWIAVGIISIRVPREVETVAIAAAVATIVIALVSLAH